MKKHGKTVFHDFTGQGMPPGIAKAIQAIPDTLSAIFFDGEKVFAAINLGPGEDADPVAPHALAAYTAAALFKPDNKDLLEELERRLGRERDAVAKLNTMPFDA